MVNLIVFLVSLALIIKSADWAMHYSSHIASDFKILKHLVGFLIVAGISVLPETCISIISTLQGEPSLALGTLFGSNVTDLTLIFALILFIGKKEIKVHKKIIKSNYFYLLTMLVPLILGLDGSYTRLEGAFMLIIGIIFYSWMLKKDKDIYMEMSYSFQLKNILYLLASMGLLLFGAYLTVKYGVSLAKDLNLSPALIGLLGISLGTTLPELFFSIKAVQKNQFDLALGDVLGTVITDAVIVVGLIALIIPFSFPAKIIHTTGMFMLAATSVLFYFMRTGHTINKKEGVILASIYVFYVLVETFFWV